MVAALLAIAPLASGRAVEALGALGVLLSFLHAQVADRLAEAEGRRATPAVECNRWLTRYFVGKELAWVAYFVATHCWSALIGCGVFLAYPLWRRWHRRAQ